MLCLLLALRLPRHDCLTFLWNHKPKQTFLEVALVMVCLLQQQEAINSEVGTRSGVLTVVFGGMWKTFKLLMREVVGCYKQSLGGHCGRRLEVSSLKAMQMEAQLKRFR